MDGDEHGRIEPRVWKAMSYVEHLENDVVLYAADLDALSNPQKAHNERLRNLLDEIQRLERKASCWLWWVLPIDRKGENGDLQTYLTRATARILLGQWVGPRSPNVSDWRSVLELLVARVAQSGIRHVLPPVDIPRVRDFVGL